jgi:hypothetical protein
MHKSHGMISLRDIASFVQKHREDEDALSFKTALGKEYARLCDSLTSAIDDAPGFYLWGRYDRKYWHSIYLGKAGFGKAAGLKRRINEELKDELCCFWLTVRTPEQLHAIRDRIYPGRYESHWKRAIEKKGATHIAWVPAPHLADQDIKPVEADLIEALDPKANIHRPIPPSSVQKEATRVFEQFRLAVHAGRANA